MISVTGILILAAFLLVNVTGSFFEEEITTLKDELNRTKAYKELCNLNLERCQNETIEQKVTIRNLENEYKNCTEGLKGAKQKIVNLARNITSLENEYKQLEGKYENLAKHAVIWKCCSMSDIISGATKSWSIDYENDNILCQGENEINCSEVRS